MNVICLDAEFADNEELLELSVYNPGGEEIYHSYYRPEKIRDWRTDIHHITPEDVADKPSFAKCRGEVGRLIEESFAVTGFAVGNDMRVLSHSGVKAVEGKRVLDVKDMFWFLRGRGEDMSPFSVPSLIACANALGLDFGEDEAHSASADTEATVRCFNLLMKEYEEKSGKEGEDAVTGFIGDIEEAKADFIEKSAAGYVRVYQLGNLHKVKFGNAPDPDRRGLIIEVSVADRYKAEYELRKLLKKKEVPDKFSLYKLTPALLDKVRGYSNVYDAEECAWCKKVVRNLTRLTL